MPTQSLDDDSSHSTRRPASGTWNQGTEHLWKTLQMINEWTRFADAKAGAVLTANGVLGTLAAGILKDLWQGWPQNYLTFVPTTAGIVCLIVSSVYCAKCLLPKVKVKEGSDSLLFFHHIAAKDEADYLHSVGDLHDDDNAFREVGKQVWANAKVAREKHREIFWAIWFTIASFGFDLIALIFALWKS